MWQDWVFTLGSFVFVIALLPSVFSVHKPSLATSLMTGTILLIFALTYATMDFIMSAAVTTVTASLWYTLAIQKFRTRKLDRFPVRIVEGVTYSDRELWMDGKR